MRGMVLRAAMAALVLTIPAAVDAQVGNPLPQSVGMAGNYTAIARGFGAVSWNPAGLGMPDNPALSLSFLPWTAVAGLDPITPAHFAEFDGQIIPESAKREWMEQIRQAGGESGIAGADINYLAFSIWRLGFQASTNVRTRMNVAPDVAEVFLFGNAGFTPGVPGDYSLDGSNFDLAATTSLAASFALPLSFELGPLPDQHFAVGATLTYTVGNFMMMGQEQNSSLSSTPLEVNVRFPMIHSQLPDTVAGETLSLNNGSGIGLDLGAAWQGGIFSAGLVVRNLINTFAWDPAMLEYRSGEATWTADTSYTSFEQLPVEQAPASLMERVHDLYEFSPVLSAGAAARVLPFLRLTGELRHAVKDNLAVSSRNHVGVGAELTIIPFIPLRAGAALISGGYQLSGGLGLKLGPAQLAASAAVREAEFGSDVVAAAGLTFGVR